MYEVVEILTFGAFVPTGIDVLIKANAVNIEYQSLNRIMAPSPTFHAGKIG